MWGGLGGVQKGGGVVGRGITQARHCQISETDRFKLLEDERENTLFHFVLFYQISLIFTRTNAKVHLTRLIWGYLPMMESQSVA
jgi:hypothetical protein